MSMLERVPCKAGLLLEMFSSAQVMGNLVCAPTREATLNNAYIQSAWNYYLMNSRQSNPLLP